MNCKYDDKVNRYVQNVNFENALVVKGRKLNYLKEHGLVEGR